MLNSRDPDNYWYFGILDLVHSYCECGGGMVDWPIRQGHMHTLCCMAKLGSRCSCRMYRVRGLIVADRAMCRILVFQIRRATLAGPFFFFFFSFLLFPFCLFHLPSSSDELILSLLLFFLCTSGFPCRLIYISSFSSTSLPLVVISLSCVTTSQTQNHRKKKKKNPATSRHLW